MMIKRAWSLDVIPLAGRTSMINFQAVPALLPQTHGMTA